MADRKRQIIETAIKIFAEKGYHAASIQEIADALGMAKGSLYFYFKSKEDLLVSICRHYLDMILRDYRAIAADKSLSPKERLKNQVILHYEHFQEHHDFYMMFLKERFEVNEDIRTMMLQLQAVTFAMNRETIIELYGDGVIPYANDASGMYSSIANGYIGYMMFGLRDLDYEEVSAFILERLDEMVAGMILKQNKPIMDDEKVNKLKMCFHVQEELNPDVLAEIQILREQSEKLDIDEAIKEEIEASLKVLEEEFEKNEPQVILVKGMIAFLKSLKRNEFKKQLSKIESYL